MVTLKDGTGTATLNPDGTITFTPNQAYNGPATFTYTVTDGKGGVDSGTVNITVSNEVHAPVANPDTNSTTEDATLTVDATNGVIHNAAGQDTDLDKDTLSVSQVALAALLVQSVKHCQAHGVPWYSTPTAVIPTRRS